MAGGTDSFLDIKDYWWLGNRYDLSDVRNVSSNGHLYYSSYSSSSGSGVRAVIKISNITITQGAGTLSNSYRTVSKATSTNEAQVGEYINVPYNRSDNACGEDNLCTFRVVAKDNDSIKVVLNGLLPIMSAWADNAEDNITTNDLIYTNGLNDFIANIDSEYITTGTYGVEIYVNNYIAAQTTSIIANIGLPTIGEMFSGNDIDMVYPTDGTKIFVDINTIENPTVSNNYWPMNRYNKYNVSEITSSGSMSIGFPSDNNGVRPVIFLKNNLTFTGGNGTAQNPYTLE